jgi:CheY-like chemotaxis protein/MinD-like ATPase involved in chromosome partitioning or flagellar assembly
VKLESKKILVVDDDPVGQRLAKAMLSPTGYEVLIASNGTTGLQMAIQEVPDLIVLDVMLPGIDGFEVCYRVRNTAKTARIPVMMLSGKAQATDRETGLKVGANEYLIKPVERQEFVSTVQKLLAQKEAVPQKRALKIAFVGSRGGVGTSTLVTSISMAMAEVGYAPILVDLRPFFSVIPALMGIKPEYPAARLNNGTAGVFNRDNLKTAFVLHSSGVRFLSTEQLPQEYGRMTPADIQAFFQEMDTLADYVLIDIPVSSSELTGAVLNHCDFINLVTSAQYASPVRISPAVDLFTKLNIDRKRLGVIIVDNTGVNVDNDNPVMTLIGGCPIMGIIPFDSKNCAEAEEKGIPVVIHADKSLPIALAFRGLAGKFLNMERQASHNRNSEGD